MIGSKFSKYFKQDVLDRNQVLKPVIVITEIEEIATPTEGGGGFDPITGELDPQVIMTIEQKKIKSLYSFTTNQENLTQRWPYDEYEDTPLEQISCLKNVSNFKISNDWDKKTLKINTLRFQLYNHYDQGKKLSEVIKQLYQKEVRLYYKSPTTNIINYYPDVLHPDFQNEDDDFYNYNCPFIFKGYITRIDIKNDTISITAEDSTQKIVGSKLVPKKTFNNLISDGFLHAKQTSIDKKYLASNVTVPMVFGYVDKSPAIPIADQKTPREIQLFFDWKPTYGNYKTSKVPSFLSNNNLPSGQPYYLYVKSGDDYLIIDHFGATTNSLENGFATLYLSGIDAVGGNFLLPVLLGDIQENNEFGLYDVIGYQQRMPEVVYGVDDSYGVQHITGIEDIEIGFGGAWYTLNDGQDKVWRLADNNEFKVKWYREGNCDAHSRQSNFEWPKDYMSDDVYRGMGRYLAFRLEDGVDNELVNIYNETGAFVGNTTLLSSYRNESYFHVDIIEDFDDPDTDSSDYVTRLGYFVAPISKEVLETVEIIKQHYDAQGDSDIILNNKSQLILQALLAETPAQLEQIATDLANNNTPEFELVAPQSDTFVNAAIFSDASDGTYNNGSDNKYWGTGFSGGNTLSQGKDYGSINGLYFGAKTQENQSILVGESPSVHNNIVLFEYFPPYWRTGAADWSLSYKSDLIMNNLALLHSVKIDDIRHQELYASIIGRKDHRFTEFIEDLESYDEFQEPDFWAEDITLNSLIKNSDGTSPDYEQVVRGYKQMFNRIINTNSTINTLPYAEDNENIDISIAIEWNPMYGYENNTATVNDQTYEINQADWSDAENGNYPLNGTGYTGQLGSSGYEGLLYSEFEAFLSGSILNSTIETEFANFQALELGDAPMLTNFTLFRNFIYRYCQIPMRMAHDFNFLYDTQGHNMNIFHWFGHMELIKYMMAYIYNDSSIIDLEEMGNADVEPVNTGKLTYGYRWKNNYNDNSDAYIVFQSIDIKERMATYVTENIPDNINNLQDWISGFYVYMDDVIQAFNHCLRDLEAGINQNVYTFEGTNVGAVWHYDNLPHNEDAIVWPGRDFEDWVSGNQWYYGLSYYETGTQLSTLRTSLAPSALGEVDSDFITSGLIEKPSDIVMNIFSNEMDVEISEQYKNYDIEKIEQSRVSHDNWSMGFSINKKTNGKKLIENILKESKSYPTFTSDGKFSLITVKESYGDEDVDKTIEESDIINYNFSQTKIEDIVTSIRAYYNYDNGTKEYTSTEYENIENYYMRYHEVAEQESLSGVFGSKRSDTFNNKTGHREMHLRYHTDSTTVKEFLQYTIMNNCIPHNICKLTLSLNNIGIEVGDIIRLPLINGEKIPSVGSGKFVVGAEDTMDYTKIEKRNGVYVYPYWVVMEKETGINNIKIKAYQLHLLKANILPDEEDFIPDEDQDNIQFSGYYFTSGEPIPNWAYYNNPESDQVIPYFDSTGDGLLNATDLVSIIGHIQGTLDTPLTQDAITRLNTYTHTGNTFVNEPNYDPSEVTIVNVLTLNYIIQHNLLDNE